MATTHSLAGMLVGLAVAPLAPAAGTTLAVAGAAGGVAPDLDALSAHRKHLHFPVVGSALAVLLVAGVAATGARWLAVCGAFAGAAALHALTDAFDGGRSVRPWAEDVERAVYCHAQGRWWRPRAWIAYDGSPADLALATVLAGAVVLAADSTVVGSLAVALLLVSVPYVLLRKRLPVALDSLARRIPAVRPDRPA